MQIQLADFVKHSPQGLEAEALLRSCVHCGFCNAVCPTYQLLGDELDGPRGRIYLIKHLLEGESATADSQMHLDRCLSCRSCETVCPSGVDYHRLLDIGRDIAERQLIRPWQQRWLRRLLLLTLPYRSRVEAMLAWGQRLRPLLPRKLRAKLPVRQAFIDWPAARHTRRMLILEGCVQPALAPHINAVTARVLDKLGISLVVVDAGCCGALPYHLNAQATGFDMMRRVIDACWPQLENGVEAIVSTASGCGVSLKEYGALLQHDVLYAEKATRIASLTKDISEILQAEDLAGLKTVPSNVAFQSPCTLQHGQGLGGSVETILSGLGFTLTAVADGHLCCGSAGTFSIQQPDIAGRLREAKLAALQSDPAQVIATANIGCLLHLQEQAQLPVVHWIELLDS